MAQKQIWLFFVPNQACPAPVAYLAPPSSQLVHSDKFCAFFADTTDAALGESVFFHCKMAGFCQHCMKASKNFQDTKRKKIRHFILPSLFSVFSMLEVPSEVLIQVIIHSLVPTGSNWSCETERFQMHGVKFY